MNGRGLAYAGATVCASLLAPSHAAYACAVCGGGGQNRQAFIDTMIFLSAMPLLMLGTFAVAVWYLAKKAREADDTAPEPERQAR